MERGAGIGPAYSAWKADAYSQSANHANLEPPPGIEPGFIAWQAIVLPMYDDREDGSQPGNRTQPAGL